MIYRFLIFFFVFLLPIHVLAAMPETSTSAKQAIIVDSETGQVLFSKNAETQMPTSSMSKVMTLLVVFDALKSGTLDIEDTFLVSEKAWRKGGSKMFVNIDSQVSVEDLIRGVAVQSGNDATIVLAEGLAGSEDAFADMLNEKAQSIGMKNSHFMNASGWPDDNHYSTAADLALMGRYLMVHYPEHYKYYGEKSFTYNSIEQQNRNPLLYRNLAADGIKTGHTEAGGYGLIGSATRNGRRVIIVVNGLDSEKARAEESTKLLEWGLGRFENVAVFDGLPSTLVNVPVARGMAEQVGVQPARSVYFTIPKGRRDKLTFTAHYKTPLIAPVQKGDTVGKLQIMLDGKILQDISLNATDSIEQAGFFSRTLDKATTFVRGQKRL